MIECQHNNCMPATHLVCQECKQELRWRWDCKSGVAFKCYGCEGTVCFTCCGKVPKMEWETFHKKFIKLYNPMCFGCGDKCYVSEGFASKVDGKIVAFCSSFCFEVTDITEDDDWDIHRMHPPEALLE